MLFIIFFEVKQIKKYFKLYEKDIDALISFTKKGIKKYWIFFSVVSCQIQLGICYIMKNELEEAKDLLCVFKPKSAYKVSYYPNFVLAIMNEDVDLIKQYYHSLMACKQKNFEQQKCIAEKILTMLETKIYDEYIYNNTNYPCVKELCLKFKK